MDLEVLEVDCPAGLDWQQYRAWQDQQLGRLGYTGNRRQDFFVPGKNWVLVRGGIFYVRHAANEKEAPFYWRMDPGSDPTDRYPSYVCRCGTAFFEVWDNYARHEIWAACPMCGCEQYIYRE